MTYYCLNCSIIVQGKRRKYCSDKCSDEHRLKKEREKYQSVRPKDSYTKSKTCELLECHYETLAEVINLYNIKLDKTSTGKNEYITKENFFIIKEKLKEYRSKPKERKEHYKKGMTINDIAKQIGESYFVVTKVLKTNTVPHIAEDLKSKYYDESVLEIIKEKAEEYKNRKQNYLDKMEITKLFGYNPKDMGSANSCFKRIKQKWGKPPSKPISIACGDTWPKWAVRSCYPKEETLKWIEEIKSTKKWQQRTPRNTLTQEERDRREEEKRQKERLFQEQTKGRITTEQAVAILGTKSTRPLKRNLDKLPGTVKTKGAFYFLEEEVKELKLYLEEEKKIQQKQSIKRKKARQEKRSPTLKKDWTADEIYEKRLWEKLQKGLPKNLKEQKDINRWNNNKRLMKNGQLGIVKTFTCTSTCGKELPYTSFYFDAKKGNKYGRESRCKACIKAREDRKEKTKQPKTASRFATQLIIAIRQELSRQNGYYVEIPAGEIWEGLEQYCGYTREQFLENIESKFAPWMTWENNKRPTFPGESTWQLDHIVARSTFKFTKMSDPEFSQCWALSNLKPLESRMNILKSNKTLREAASASFLSGLRKGKCKNGVWKHLPYTPLEAREYFEKQLGEQIDWPNFKSTGLEIDHIIPQAYLAFESYSDKNFRECWALKNLQVLTKTENIAKSSVYKEVLWLHNNI